MNKPNLTIKIETTNEIKNLKCTRCFGTGLIKRKIQFSCDICKNEYKFCYKCENQNKSIWIECIKCLGSGEIEKKYEIKSKHKYINEHCRNSI